jgi:hypothetical protein
MLVFLSAPVFALKDQGKPRIASVRIAGSSAEIHTEYMANTNPERLSKFMRRGVLLLVVNFNAR